MMNVALESRHQADQCSEWLERLASDEARVQVVTSSGTVTVSSKLLQLFSPLARETIVSIGAVKENIVLMIPDAEAKTVHHLINFLSKGQIDAGGFASLSSADERSEYCDVLHKNIVGLARCLQVDMKNLNMSYCLLSNRTTIHPVNANVNNDTTTQKDGKLKLRKMEELLKKSGSEIENIADKTSENVDLNSNNNNINHNETINTRIETLKHLNVMEVNANDSIEEAEESQKHGDGPDEQLQGSEAEQGEATATSTVHTVKANLPLGVIKKDMKDSKKVLLVPPPNVVQAHQSKQQRPSSPLQQQQLPIADSPAAPLQSPGVDVFKEAIDPKISKMTNPSGDSGIQRPSSSAEKPPNLLLVSGQGHLRQGKPATAGAGPSPPQQRVLILDDNIQPPAPNTRGPYSILCSICNLVKGRYPNHFFQHLAATHYKSNLAPLLSFSNSFYHCPNCSFKHKNMSIVITHLGVEHKKVKELLGSKVVGRYIPESERAPGRPADICAYPDQPQQAGVEGDSIVMGGVGDQPPPGSEQGGGQDTRWQTDVFRQRLIRKLEEAIKDTGRPADWNAVELERQVFQKATSKEVYLSYVAGLIFHVTQQEHEKVEELIGSKVVGRYIPAGVVSGAAGPALRLTVATTTSNMASATSAVADADTMLKEENGNVQELTNVAMPPPGATPELRQPSSLQSEPSTFSGPRQQRAVGIKKSITWRSLGSTTVTRKEGRIIVSGPDQAAAKSVASQLASGQAKLGSRGGKQVLIMVSDAVDTASISRRFFCYAPAKIDSKK